jgi:hypothetical protein
MVLPGGTLLALLLFLCQRKRPDIARRVQQAAAVAMRMLEGVSGQRTIRSEP